MATATRTQLAEALRRAGWPEKDIPTAVAIAFAESGGRTDAVCNSCLGVREYSVGPWQINLYAHPWVTESCAKDINCAAAAARRIYESAGGFTPWSVFTSGRYREFLGAYTPSGASEGSGSASGEFGDDGLWAGEMDKEAYITEKCGERPAWSDLAGQGSYTVCRVQAIVDRAIERGKDPQRALDADLNEAEEFFSPLGNIDTRKLGITALFIVLGLGIVFIAAMKMAADSKTGQAVIAGATGVAKKAATKGVA